MAQKFNSGEGSAPSPSGVETGGACDNYRIDMTASKFGACKCGWPKADHKISAAAPQRARPAWKPQQMKLHPSDGPQGAVNMRHPPTGRPMDVRMQEIQAKVHAQVEAAVVDAVTSQPQPAKPAVKAAKAEATAEVVDVSEAQPACDNYRLDMAAARFGDCKCGRPKSEHKVTNTGGARPKPGSGGAMGDRAALLGAMFNPAMLQPGGRPSARERPSAADEGDSDGDESSARDSVRSAAANAAAMPFRLPMPAVQAKDPGEATKQDAAPTDSGPSVAVGEQTLAVLAARPAGAAGRRRGKVGARAAGAAPAATE